MTGSKIDQFIVHRSDLRGSSALSVVIIDMPSDLEPTTFRIPDIYSFGYRPRVEKGETYITVPERGLANQRQSRERTWLFSPNIKVRAEWRNAAGRIACFFFNPQFLEAMATSHGIPFSKIRKMETPPFSIDDRIESLCRLLMNEAEDRGGRGLVYCNGLANALAVSALYALDEQRRRDVRFNHVPVGIWRAIELLETEFAKEHSIVELAEVAHLGRTQFLSMFRRATSESPHKYLTRVRLHNALWMLDGKSREVSLADIATACGFADQSHLNRRFRQLYGTTPAAFQRRQRKIEDRE
jgi:AraC-like DNA-binding protein